MGKSKISEYCCDVPSGEKCQIFDIGSFPDELKKYKPEIARKKFFKKIGDLMPIFEKIKFECQLQIGGVIVVGKFHYNIVFCKKDGDIYEVYVYDVLTQEKFLEMSAFLNRVFRKKEKRC